MCSESDGDRCESCRQKETAYVGTETALVLSIVHILHSNTFHTVTKEPFESAQHDAAVTHFC